MRLNIKHEVVRQAVTVPLCWIASVLAWLTTAAAVSAKLTDVPALLFLGTAELLMFHWITYLFGLIFVREALEGYRPRWVFVVVGIMIGVCKAGFYTVLLGGQSPATLLANPWLYAFVAQGIVAGICFVALRPTADVGGFPVVTQDASDGNHT